MNIVLFYLFCFMNFMLAISAYTFIGILILALTFDLSAAGVVASPAIVIYCMTGCKRRGFFISVVAGRALEKRNLVVLAAAFGFDAALIAVPQRGFLCVAARTGMPMHARSRPVPVVTEQRNFNRARVVTAVVRTYVFIHALLRTGGGSTLSRNLYKIVRV